MTTSPPIPPKEAANTPTAEELGIVEPVPRILGEKQAYEFYLKYCGVRKYEPLDLATWRAVTRQGNLLIGQALVNRGEKVSLPYGLGNLVVLRKRTNFQKPSIDWHQTKLQGKVCYHINEHSDFFCSQLHWEKKTCTFWNNAFYAFKPVRNVSRAIAAHMKTPGGYLTYNQKPVPPTLRSKSNAL